MTFGLVDNHSGSFINDFSVDTRSAASGVIGLKNNILVDEFAGDLGSVTLAGDVRLNPSVPPNILIDTEQGNDATGGPISLNNAIVSASTQGINLTLDTSTTPANANGGAVSLFTFNNAAGQFVDNLSIDASPGAGGTAGLLSLAGNISLNPNGADAGGNFTFAGDGKVELFANVTIDTENGNANPGGKILLGGGEIFGDIANRRFTLDAQGLTDGGNIDFGNVDAGAAHFWANSELSRTAQAF